MTAHCSSLVSRFGFSSLVIGTVVIGCGSSTTNTNLPTNAGGSPITSGGATSTVGGTTGSPGGTASNAGGTNGSTGGTPSSVGGAVSATGGAVSATGGAVSATGGAVSATGGAVSATGGAISATGGAISATGGAVGATGGAVGATGGVVGAAGGAVSATGGVVGATGGASTTVCPPPSKPAVLKCTGTAPPAALISDFTTTATATTPTVFGIWGQNIYGGGFVYPANAATPGPCDVISSYPLTQDFSGGNWHIQGSVGTYSGLGFWYSCNTGTAAAPVYTGACTINASAYTGISFTVSGNAGPAIGTTGTGGIYVGVSTASTTKPTLDYLGAPNNCGTCTAASCGTSVVVPVTATATTVTLTWAQLGVTTPNAVTGISFSFTDPYSYATTPAVAVPYTLNLTIDNLQFTL